MFLVGYNRSLYNEIITYPLKHTSNLGSQFLVVNKLQRGQSVSYCISSTLITTEALINVKNWNKTNNTIKTKTHTHFVTVIGIHYFQQNIIVYIEF